MTRSIATSPSPSRSGDVSTWPAMGTTARAWFADRSGVALDAARSRVATLEAQWSRFLPTSDVARLSASAGHPVPVTPETLDLLEHALAWWGATDGLFDPTVLHALETAGYDRDLGSGHGAIGAGQPSPGLAGLVLDRTAGTAMLPPGVGIDLGGIGKGQAVDLVTTELRHIAGGLVDLGGDLRVWGTSPDEAGWPIAVDDARDGSPLAVLGLQEGAVATSTTLRRRWTDGERTAHHLIDPRTGRPSTSEIVAVTVAAAAAAPAEVLAKVALLTGTVDAAAALLVEHGVAGLVVPATGAPVVAGGFQDMCWTLSPEVR